MLKGARLCHPRDVRHALGFARCRSRLPIRKRQSSCTTRIIMRDGAGRLTLLVVDDDPDWRLLYKLEFGDRFDVIEAADGHDGLEKLAMTGPDLVILDLSMPRMDGVGFLARLRDAGVSTPVIVCTAFGPEAQDLVRGHVRFVHKSPDLAELARAVQTLSRSR